MSPTSTQLQQALALRKQNPNLTVGEAVSQVKSQATPAPVAPTAPVAQTPAPAPSPTPLPEAKAWDVVVGQGGEKFIQENNKDMTTTQQGPSQVVNQSGQDLSKLEQVQAQAFGRREGMNTQGVMPNNPNPVTPTQTTPTTPTAVTTTPATPVEATPAPATTTTTPIQTTTQAKQTPVAQPTDENSIMTVLKTNGPVADAIKNSPSYQSVKQTYDKVKQFSTYSTNNLVTALNNGTLLPGTKVYNELLNDPAMKQKLTDAQVYTTKKPVDLQSVTQSVSGEILSNNPRTANAFSDGTLTAAEYASLTNTPEVIAKATDVEAKTNKYNTLKASYDAIDEEVDKEFPGSRFADDIKADRKKAKYKDLVLAKGELDAAVGTLTELKSQAASLFETNFKLYQDQQQQANAYKMADYNAALGLKTKQAELEMQKNIPTYQTLGDKVYKLQNGVLTDTGISAKSIQDKKFGVVGQHYDDNTGTMVNDYGFVNENTGEIIRVGGGGGGATGGGTGGGSTGNYTSGITSAADFTKSKEGFRSNAYYDVNGWAIGYGQHSINGVPVKPTDTIDEATATADLNNRIGNAKFNSLVTVPLSEPQKAALYSLEHNVGSGVWTFPNGKKIIDQINSGDFQGASNTLASSGIGTTNAATKTVLPGLVARRKEEAQLLLDTGKQEASNFSGKLVEQFKEYGAKPPEEYKSLVQKRAYTDAYSQWRQENPQILSKDEKKDVSGIQNNLAGDQRRKDYLAMSSKEKTLSGIQERLAKGTATPQDKQQLVNDFAKILDPTSVVREGEYALAGKYAQSKIDQWKQEIGNFFYTNGPLSNDAAKMLAEGVARRQQAINQANNDAINEALSNVETFIGRKVPAEALGAKYSTNTQAQQEQQTTQTQQTYTKKDNPLGLNL